MKDQLKVFILNENSINIIEIYKKEVLLNPNNFEI